VDLGNRQLIGVGGA